jgi:hypothetical protein
MIKKIAVFLQLVDASNRLDVTNLAFFIIMGKVVAAETLDWPAVITLATVCLNKIHKRYNYTAEDTASTTKEIKELKDQITPIVEKVKEIIK